MTKVWTRLFWINYGVLIIGAVVILAHWTIATHNPDLIEKIKRQLPGRQILHPPPVSKPPARTAEDKDTCQCGGMVFTLESGKRWCMNCGEL